MARRGPRLAAGLALFGLCLGGSSAAGSSTVHRAVCPRTDTRPPVTSRPAGQPLVPAGATGALLCRYRGMNPDFSRYGHLAYTARVTSAVVLGRLAGDFDALRPFPRGPTSCPADDGARIVAFFRYRRGPDEPVVVDLGGCAKVTNGPVTLTAGPHPGPRLLARLRYLTRCTPQRWYCR
jgi:hypothetical protein